MGRWLIQRRPATTDVSLTGFKTWIIVEPLANDKLEDNLNAMGAPFYCVDRCRKMFPIAQGPGNIGECRSGSLPRQPFAAARYGFPHREEFEMTTSSARRVLLAA